MHNDINVTVSGPVQLSSTYKTVVLKGNQSFASQATEPNIMYVIRWDFDLHGQSIVVPENCILKFDGGSLDNGVIVGQDTVFINVGDVDIWGEHLTREGTWTEKGGLQDAFGKVKVGEDIIEAAGNDTLEIEAGDNVTIEADPETKKIVINAESEEQVQSDWDQTDDEAKDYIKNKPTIPQVDNNLDQNSENPVQNKIIAAKVSNLQEQIDAIVIGGATVNLSASPLTVLVGVQHNISLSAYTDTQSTSIKIKRDNMEIASGSGLTLSYNDSITPATAGNISYLAEFYFGNTKKTASKNVAAVYPIKYGAGDDYTDAVNQASARTTPAGTYSVIVASNGQYVWFVVPATMIINRATMSGFDFPLEAPQSVTIGGVAYKSYKSSNTYDAGTLTIIIS